jgi:hypothetical protein
MWCDAESRCICLDLSRTKPRKEDWKRSVGEVACICSADCWFVS